MWTLLFDIDGTLLRTGGAGWLAIERAMGELHGTRQVPKIPVGGRTDKGIFVDLFEAAGIDFSAEAYDEFRGLYHDYLPQMMHETGARLLPGVSELLEILGKRSDVSLGLLTGNSESAAKVKVDHFGLGGYFKFGGFGDQHAERDKVAEAAVTAAQAVLPSFESSETWVIGDTIHDITCARSVGAKVLAVTTGSGKRDELNDHAPDLLFDDLADHQAFLSLVLGQA